MVWGIAYATLGELRKVDLGRRNGSEGESRSDGELHICDSKCDKLKGDELTY